ncbi:MAG: hypothetical protein RLZ12_374 [Bacillota bacterium]|jgi:UDP-N-acetylmuramoyl-L-alanyl-D-glutamate--2,6-diaminopimelate ligase
MYLSTLLKKVPHQLLHKTTALEIKGLAIDSRKVQTQDLFFALPGQKDDGHKYIKDAVRNGAVAIIAEHKPLYHPDVSFIKVANIRKVLAHISCEFFQHPSRKLQLIGITGTNGKTSTTHFLSQILNSLNYKTGTIGTLGAKISSSTLPDFRATNHSLTTPEAPYLQELLQYMHNKQVTHVAIEVSSVALEEERVTGCNFAQGILTNITSDHLDYHHTQAKYIAAKQKLFTFASKKVLNVDDLAATNIMLATASPTITYSITDPKADLRAIEITYTTTNTSCLVTYKKERYPVTLNILGEFNLYNALAAAASLLQLNFPLEKIIPALKHLQPAAGRFNQINLVNGPIVIIDYAHTQDALKKILTTLKSCRPDKLIVVFGCGGDRDASKRPTMGKTAGTIADYCLITSDNPRSENPKQIMKEIASGIKDTSCSYKLIHDRQKAILSAIEIAKPNDIILIAGKGHETFQEINGEKYPFNDLEIVKSAWPNS